MADNYDLSLWDAQDHYIEVWVEKDALSQVISRIAREYRVLTAPSRGYSSFSYLYRAVTRFNSHSDKTCLVIFFSDHDPSGLDMHRDLESRFFEYGANIEVIRPALTLEQVKQYDLSPYHVKVKDSRAPDYISAYGHDSWELDALPPNVLQQLVKDNIKEYIDQKKWDDRLKEIETNKDIIRSKVDDFFSNIKGGDL